MHKYQAESVTFFYNADFSGNVIIIKDGGEEWAIPARDVLEFVAYCYVARNRVIAIESLSSDELLK